MAENKKTTATPLWVGDVLEGRFNLQNQPFSSQEFCLQDGRVIEKIALSGIIVENQYLNDNPFLLLDDGSGVITIRAFEMPEHVRTLPSGCPVKIIGKPKLFMNVVYVFADIIKKLPGILWFEVWKKTVPRVNIITTPVIPAHPEEQKKRSEEEQQEKIILFIHKKDSGDGVEVDSIIQESNIPDCDTLLASLLLKGRIFEVGPGKVKVLD